MSPPKTKYQREMDHELKHFSACYTSNYGLTGALDVKKIVNHCRRNEGLVKYIMFKRAFSMTNQSLVENLKKHGTGTTNALHRKLVHLRRRSYNNTTPANAWKLLFCRLPVTILKNKVYSNTMLWVRDGMKGMMVNQFIVMWPLFLAGYVDRLDDPEKKSKWHDIFVGEADQVMADMVIELGWNKMGYPMDIPDPGKGKPKLRIATYNRDEKNDWEKSLGEWKTDIKKKVCDMLKNGPSSKGKYRIGGRTYKPNYAERHMHEDNLLFDRDANSEMFSSFSYEESDDTE